MEPFAVEKKDLEAYTLLGYRVRDFIHLTLLWQRVQEGLDLLEGVPNLGPDHLADTLRTASLGWLASLVDPHKSAVNAFRVWPKIFPHRKTEIENAERLLAPHMKTLQAFRDTVAFHSNKSIKEYQKARAGIKNPDFIKATEGFLDFAEQMLNEEERVLGLSKARASMEGKAALS
jgi:hypothetical protein